MFLEDTFEYRIKKVLRKYCQATGMQWATLEELRQSMWDDNNAIDFAHMIIEDMEEYGGDKMFEI